MGFFNNIFSKDYTEVIEKALSISDKIDNLQSEILILGEERKNAENSFNVKTSRLGVELKKGGDKNLSFLQNRLKERHESSISEIKSSILTKTTEYHILKGELNEMLKNKKVSNLFKSETEKHQIGSSYELIKEAFSSGIIDRPTFKDARKKAEKKLKNQVHYADMLVFNKKGELLLLQRSSTDDMFPSQWCLPGGHVDHNEEGIKASQRELEEEALITLTDEVITKRHELKNDKAFIEYFDVLLKDTPIVALNSREHQNYEWVSIDKINDYDLILDLKSTLNDVFKQSDINSPEPIKKALDAVILGLNEGIIKYEDIEKAHKYISRIGTPGNYVYKYREEAERKKSIIGDQNFDNIKKVLEPLLSDKKEKDTIFISELERLSNNIADDYTYNLQLSMERSFKDEESIFNEKDRQDFFKNLPKTSIDVSNLILAQKIVRKSILNLKVKKNDNNPIDVFKVEDKYFVYDGNHRAVLSILNGDKKIEAKVYDFTEKLKDADFQWNFNDSKNRSEFLNRLNEEKNTEQNKTDYEHIRKNVVDDKIEKAFQTIKLGYEEGLVSQETFIKALKVYSDNAENRKLNRVGQKWGSDGEEKPTEKRTKKGEEIPTTRESSEKPIEEYAKQTSDQALEQASKGGDEELRIAAKKELERRETEYKSDETEKGDLTEHKKVKEELDKIDFTEKFRQLSDEQIKFYIDAPYPKVKEAAQLIAKERGLSIISKDDYIKQFEDFDKSDKEEGRDFYKKDRERCREYLSKNESEKDALQHYMGVGFKNIRDILSGVGLDKDLDREDLRNKYNERIKNISNFINNNKIEHNLSLNRRVLTGNTFFNELKEGDIYEDKSFSSTSLFQRSEFGDFNIKILAKKGSKVANVDNYGEHEYLIDKNSKFRVIDIHYEMVLEKRIKSGMIVELI